MEQFRQISSRSISLKKYLKIPMVLLTWSTGTFSGMNVVLIKCFGEVLKAGDFKRKPIFTSSLLAFALTGGLVQMIVLNVAMKYYDNIDVMPAY